VIVAVDLAPVVTNLLSLVAYLILVLARFTPVALTNLVVTPISQFLQLSLIVTQSFTLPVVARRVVVGVRAHARDDQRCRQ
jgi:hypothetical protein